MKFSIDVTADDIDRGVERSHHFCPIALSLKRIFRDYRTVSVGRSRFSVTLDNDSVYHGLLPSKASSFTHTFDMGLDVLPFSFEVSTDE